MHLHHKSRPLTHQPHLQLKGPQRQPAMKHKDVKKMFQLLRGVKKALRSRDFCHGDADFHKCANEEHCLWNYVKEISFASLKRNCELINRFLQQSNCILLQVNPWISSDYHYYVNYKKLIDAAVSSFADTERQLFIPQTFRPDVPKNTLEAFRCCTLFTAFRNFHARIVTK